MSLTVPLAVNEILKKAIGDEFKNFVVTLENTNRKGDNFSGHIFFVSLENKNNGERLNYVVKQGLYDPKIRAMHPIREAFLNEIYFYTEVWTKFLHFQEKVPPEHRFVQIPRCLATDSEENLEMLVLEDAKYQGFMLHDKKKPFDKDMFEFIFKVYAKFHALSFAYKALNPKGFTELCTGVIDVWKLYLQKKLFQNVIKGAHEQCLEILQFGADEAVIEKYRHYVDDGVDLMQQSLVNGKHTVIVHCDCWSNNMLFKYDDKKVIDMKLLDFQNVRLGSPVCDLAYCLYSGGTKEVYDDLDHLLQVYHDSLSESLKAFGCDPQELYPLEALKNDWKVYCQLGATMGIMLWRGKLTRAEDATDLSDASPDEGGNNFFGDKFDLDTYRERARDIVYHLYNRNFIV